MAYTTGKPRGRDLEVLYLHLRGLGNAEIASEIGMAPGTVSNIVNSSWFQKEIKGIHSTTVSKLTSNNASAISIAKANAPRMMEMNLKMAEESKNERVRQIAIHDILDRSLGRSIQRTANVDDPNEMVERMSIEELDAFVKDGTLPHWASENVSTTKH